MTEPEDTREQLAAALERLAVQVREHGVQPGWEINSRAEGVKVASECGRFLNTEQTGLFHHTVKFDIDRSESWRREEVDHV
jgi:hypothetical protein